MNINKLYRFSRKLRAYFYIYWNRLFFLSSGVKFGRNMHVYNKFYLQKSTSAKISIGNNFEFSSGEAFNPLCRNIRGCIYASKNACIHIGNNVGISSACIWASEGIIIKNNVKIGGGSILIDTDAHSLDYMQRRHYSTDLSNTKSCAIVIEDDVLIGTNCIILKGVTIGAHSIIGAGSVVTKSIPSDCIAAGNPAKIVKHLIM